MRDPQTRRNKNAVVRAEAIGLIVIAILILAFTLLRYSGNINWSAR
jgi:hypothetical protein